MTVGGCDGQQSQLWMSIGMMSANIGRVWVVANGDGDGDGDGG